LGLARRDHGARAHDSSTPAAAVSARLLPPPTDRSDPSTAVAMRRTDVRGRRTDVRGRKTDVRGRRTDVLSQTTAVAMRTTDARGRRTDARGRRTDVRGRKTDVRGRKTDVRGRKTHPVWRRLQKFDGTTDTCAIGGQHPRPTVRLGHVPHSQDHAGGEADSLAESESAAVAESESLVATGAA
jgi:hypothetical protein